jgi:hypothetical protein
MSTARTNPRCRGRREGPKDYKTNSGRFDIYVGEVLCGWESRAAKLWISTTQRFVVPWQSDSALLSPPSARFAGGLSPGRKKEHTKG